MTKGLKMKTYFKVKSNKGFVVAKADTRGEAIATAIRIAKAAQIMYPLTLVRVYEDVIGYLTDDCEN